MRYHEIALDEIAIIGGVFEPYDQPDFNKVKKKLIGTYEGIDIYKAKDYLPMNIVLLALYKGEIPVGFLIAKEIFSCLQISPFIYKKYRGKGIALKGYKFLLDKGYILQSEGYQTKGGMKIWKALMNDPKYEIKIWSNIDGYDNKITNPWNNDKGTILIASLKSEDED